LAFFQGHPELRERLSSIVGAVGNAAGNLGEADAAEELLVEEVRLLGREATRSWADERVVATEWEARLQPDMRRQGKKTLVAHEIRRDHRRRAFAASRIKLREYYDSDIEESTIRRITLGHARAMFESGRAGLDFPHLSGLHKQIVAQIDGGMIPVVEPDASRRDKRKGKTLSWWHRSSTRFGGELAKTFSTSAYVAGQFSFSART
jgi:hypothetical protein